MFRCLVVNNLNGAKSLFDHSSTYSYDANDKEAEYLGEFAASTPHIYPTPENNNGVKQHYTYTVLL